jgi:hypothetical protein
MNRQDQEPTDLKTSRGEAGSLKDGSGQNREGETRGPLLRKGKRAFGMAGEPLQGYSFFRRFL